MRMLSARRRRTCPTAPGPAPAAAVPPSKPPWTQCPRGRQTGAKSSMSATAFRSSQAAVRATQWTRLVRSAIPSIQVCVPCRLQAGTVLIFFSIARGRQLLTLTFLYPGRLMEDARDRILRELGRVGPGDRLVAVDLSQRYRRGWHAITGLTAPRSLSARRGSQPTRPRHNHRCRPFGRNPIHVHRQRRGERRCHRWRSQLRPDGNGITRAAARSSSEGSPIPPGMSDPLSLKSSDSARRLTRRVLQTSPCRLSSCRLSLPGVMGSTIRCGKHVVWLTTAKALTSALNLREISLTPGSGSPDGVVNSRDCPDAAADGSLMSTLLNDPYKDLKKALDGLKLPLVPAAGNSRCTCMDGTGATRRA